MILSDRVVKNVSARLKQDFKPIICEEEDRLASSGVPS